MKVVISQPMYFPWVGLLEQVRISDHFVHYDDVQLTRGFYNRVQIKTKDGSKWMTVPLRDAHRGQLLNEVEVDEREDWREKHRRLLKQACAGAPFIDDMLSVADRVFSQALPHLAAISRASTMAIANYFGLTKSRNFVDSSMLQIPGKSSQRLFDICRHLQATTYVTGHGAKNYLDHEMFERGGITVEYMDYLCLPYPQLHGTFTPYISSLDLIANCGQDGLKYISSGTCYWRKFINEP